MQSFLGITLFFFFFLFGRKKSSSTAPKAKKAKTDKKSKDPNAPKRPQTAFFLFMYTISQSLSCTFGLSFRVCVCAEMFSICVSGMTSGRLIKKKIPIRRVVKRYKYLLITALALSFLFFVRWLNFGQVVLIFLFDLQWIVGSKGGWWEVEISRQKERKIFLGH